MESSKKCSHSRAYFQEQFKYFCKPSDIEIGKKYLSPFVAKGTWYFVQTQINSQLKLLYFELNEYFTH